MVAKEGYVINPATGNERELQHPVAPNPMRGLRRGSRKRGMSGYDPDYPDMRGAFMARGPGNCISIQFKVFLPLLKKFTVLPSKPCLIEQLSFILTPINISLTGFNIKQEAQDPIEIVDLYMMFCHLLNISAKENDGVWERIKGLLRNSSSTQIPSNFVLLLTFCVLIWTTEY